MGLENLVWAKLGPDITPPPKKKKKLPSPLLKLDDASLTLQIWNQKRNLSKKLLLRARLRSDQISLSLSHHMAPVAPRSGDAIFASVERVVSPKAPLFLVSKNCLFSIPKFPIHFLENQTELWKIGVECGAVYLDVRCDRAPVAYRSGGGWGSQQAAWSNVNFYFFISFLRFFPFIFRRFLCAIC